MAADLRRFYSVRLSDMWAGIEDPLEVAHCAAHLPRGGAVGQWVGGPAAITAEVEAGWLIEHQVAVSNNSKNPSKVKPRKYPDGVRQQEQREQKLADQARRFREKRRGR